MTKRKTSRKDEAKSTTPKTPISEISVEQQIVGAPLLGKVQHYLPESRVMTLVLETPLAVGETIRVKGQTTDLTQKVEKIQVKQQSVQSAVPGEAVRLEIADPVRPGDAVYKI